MMMGIYRDNYLTKEQKEFFVENKAKYLEQKNAWVIDKSNIKEIENIKNKLLDDKYVWDIVLNSSTNIKCLAMLQERGLPFSKAQRITLYKKFFKRGPGNYPIDLGGIITAFPEFREIYDLPTLYKKIPQILNGSGNYRKAIKQADFLSEEEKALILLAFPLSEEMEKEIYTNIESENIYEQ